MANMNVVNEYFIRSEGRYITAGTPLSLQPNNALVGATKRQAIWRFIYMSTRIGNVYKIFNPENNCYLQFGENGNVEMVADQNSNNLRFFLSNGFGTDTKISEYISCHCRHPTQRWLSFNGNQVVYVEDETQAKRWNLEAVGE